MWVLFGFATGAILGSFVKALADRSLAEKSFLGRSKCPKCNRVLAWYDLIPVLSYIFLKGKCRYCGKGIDMEYLLVEAGMGLLVGFLFWEQFSNFQLFSKIFFITILAAVFLTDLKQMFIPDRVIVPALGTGIIIKALTPHFWQSILMGILIGGFFWSLILITRGKGMGGGDVKLGAFIGVMLGFPQALLAIFLGFLTGAIFSLWLLSTGKKHFGEVIPFGPFLVLGSIISLFWGDWILNWYLNFKY